MWGGLAVIAAVFAVALYLFALSWRPSAQTYQFQGVDVSAANGAIDWNAVKAAGAEFGYIVATDGAERDARFEDNWRGAAAAELRRGAIHAWSLCRPAADQANNFNTTVPNAGRRAAPGAGDRLRRRLRRAARRAMSCWTELRRFVTMVEAHTERPVILLVSRAFEAQYRVTEAIDRPVWSAQNFFAPDYAARPWRMWRANDMRRIDGVDGPVNWDVVAK